MKRPGRSAQDPIEAAIEAALCPGHFISYRAMGSFVEALGDPAKSIADLVKIDPARAVSLYTTYLAACYEKAEEIDDSDGDFAMFIHDLYAGWTRAR
ncbi:MAG: hypothetical protein U0167_14185 [bacterium]